MSPKPKVPMSRYSVRACALEVSRVMKRIGRGAQKGIALGLDLTEAQMSAKIRTVSDNFTVEQLGQVAELLDAPAGWPWVPWEERDLLTALPRLRSLTGVA